MKREHWLDAELFIEQLNCEITYLNEELDKINHFKLSLKVNNCIREMCNIANNLQQYSNAIYCVCENDRANTADLEGYKEVIKLLPDGSKLSLAEVDALVEHIKTWRKEHGYPEV